MITKIKHSLPIKTAIIKQVLKRKFLWHLTNLVAYLRLKIFVKVNLQQWIDKSFNELPKMGPKPIKKIYTDETILSLQLTNNNE